MLGLQLISWPNLIPWIFRAWSMLALILLSVVYFLCLRLFTDISTVNKYYGAFLQILGGAIVLFAIIENLNIFRSKTVWELIIEWVTAFPIRRIHNLNIETILPEIHVSFELTHLYPTEETLEDRLKNIERKIQSIEEMQNQGFKNLSSKIEKSDSELEKYMNDAHSKINKLDNNLKTAMAGDVQSPIFGVLLAIVGTIISLFS